jgi:N-acetyl-anhydromuramyl-L-alanine amidase AmpD
MKSADAEIIVPMAIDVDGAPNTYGPNDGLALDYELNARYWSGGRPTERVAGYRTRDGTYRTPIIQGPNDPCPGFYISTSSYFDSRNANDDDPRKYVNAAEINFTLWATQAKRAGVQLGDFCVVHSLRTNQVVFALVGDSGNSSGQEGSLALLQRLGYQVSNGKAGGEAEAKIVVRYFANTNSQRQFFFHQYDLDTAARALNLDADFSSYHPGEPGTMVLAAVPPDGTTPVVDSGIVFRAEGKMSTFGGPQDFGMTPSEGLALFDKPDLNNPKHAILFLPAPPPGTSGLGRRLNPDKYYLACRWDYTQTSRDLLRNTTALVRNPQNGKSAYARPVDWGPNISTGRVADLSPGLAGFLGLDTDEDVVITISPGNGASNAPSTSSTGSAGNNDRHGSNNPFPKPPINSSHQSPFHSSRNGARIEFIVLHCTESSLENTIIEFTTGQRQVSAHYVIDKDGTIYQMVLDSERANHARGANSNSIGIEHVAQDSEPLSEPQALSSSSLIRWLLAQYDIPRTAVYGHDFAPGYNQSHGGTSCPDKLFGSAHSQQSVAQWVAANV